MVENPKPRRLPNAHERMAIALHVVQRNSGRPVTAHQIVNGSDGAIDASMVSSVIRRLLQSKLLICVTPMSNLVQEGYMLARGAVCDDIAYTAFCDMAMVDKDDPLKAVAALRRQILDAAKLLKKERSKTKKLSQALRSLRDRAKSVATQSSRFHHSASKTCDTFEIGGEDD